MRDGLGRGGDRQELSRWAIGRARHPTAGAAHLDWVAHGIIDVGRTVTLQSQDLTKRRLYTCILPPQADGWGNRKNK